MIVYFTRHGESTANTRRVISNRNLAHPLTDAGRMQARQLAEKLGPAGISRIYTSPVPRALETATIISQVLEIPLQTSEGLREFDVGILEGRSGLVAWVRFADLWSNWFEKRLPEKRIKGGENFYEAQGRFISFMDQLSHLYGSSDARILCVTHGGILKVGLPALLDNLDFDRIRSLPINYAAAIITEYDGVKWRCTHWNDVILAEGR